MSRTLDPEVRSWLGLLNETFPPVHTMTGQDARAAIAARRQPVANLGDARADDREVDTADGPLRVRVYRPTDEADGPRPVVVFCHGGGFVFCDLETHDGFCRALSRYTDAVVVAVDYRLAPEHLAPAAAEDAFAAFRWAVDHATDLGGDPARVLVMGDSAGGNLAAVVALLARERGGPMPVGQVLLYPVVDPACDGGSHREFGSGYYNTTEAMRWYWSQYLGGPSSPDRLGDAAYVVAPLRAGSHRDLPPAVVVTAGCDPLRDEGKAYVDALRAAGVPVRHRDYPGLFHGFLTMLALRAGQSARDLLWSDVRELVR